jgi:peptide/nickel transport system substrate-binding protein
MPSVEGSTTAYEPTITQALAQINIKVTWETTPFSQIVDRITSGTMPLYYWPVGWNNMPTNLDVMVRPNGFFNAYKSSTPQMEKLLAAADSATDEAGVANAYQDISKYLIDQAWFAPMFTVPNLYGASKTVVYQPHQIDLTDNIRYYTLAG